MPDAPAPRLSDEGRDRLEHRVTYDGFYKLLASDVDALLAELRRAESAEDDWQEVTNKLQALCDKYGCEPGMNRFAFLDEQLGRLASLTGEVETVAREIAHQVFLMRQRCAHHISDEHSTECNKLTAAISQALRARDEAGKAEREGLATDAALLSAHFFGITPDRNTQTEAEVDKTEALIHAAALRCYDRKEADNAE